MIDQVFSMNVNPLFALSILLISGVGLGYCAKLLKLPGLIGQILAGVLIGPYVLQLFNTEVYHGFSPVTDFALSLFGLTLGSHLHLRKLHNAGKRIFLILLSEILIVPTIIHLVLFYLLNIPAPQSILLAAIGLETSASATLHLITEKRSKGVFTKTLVTAVALNNVAALVLFSFALRIALGIVQPHVELGIIDLLISTGIEIFGALFFGTIIALIILFFSRRDVPTSFHFSSLIIGIFFITGVLHSLGMPGFLSSMVLGFIITNYSQKKKVILSSINNIEPTIYALFFVLAGTHIDFKMAGAAGVAGLAFITARIIGKSIAPRVGTFIAGASKGVRQWMGFALLPEAGVSIGLVVIVESQPEFAHFSDYITTIVLSAVVFFEIIGPLLTHRAIIKSGEENKNRSRILDFLQEEYILVGLKETDKWKALEELAAFMYRVHGIHEITLEALIERIFERERKISTGIGECLAVPHAIVDGGPKIRGVIGISHKGIKFESIDGKPVNLLVLIATPQENYDQHLHVLSTISKIFGKYPETKNEILMAKTSAEVHEILQSGEADALNVYLEEV